MRQKRTLGLDEAGRGPVIGPMVMAAVCLDTRGASALSRAGVRDSKAYGASDKAKGARADLARRVREVALHAEVRVIDVDVIDARVRRSELNQLEREVATELIDGAPTVDRIVADGKVLFASMRARFAHLEAHNDGESKHCAVAAASILAKVRRDELFGRIAARYRPLFGDIRGGGYGNAATRRFLRAYAERFGGLPPEARRSWPYDHLRDVLGDGFDPFADLPPGRAPAPQISLFG